MRTVTIISLPDYCVLSHWNGAAYTIERKTDGASLFLQGDDAAEWRREFVAYETKFPELPTSEFLKETLSLYHLV
jgi:hypothetical protein